MTFFVLEDQAVRRLAHHLTVQEGKASYVLSGRPSESKRTMLEGHKRAGRLASNELLDAALQAIGAAESKVRKVKLSGLSGAEIRKFQSSTISVMVKSIEDRKAQQLKKSLEKVHERRRSYEEKSKDRSYPDSLKRLGRLEELKLIHTFTDEAKAMAKFAKMERVGYDELEALVLGSKGERAHGRMLSLKESVPPYLADQNGIAIVKEIRELTELQPGELFYQLKGTDVHQRVNISDLLTDLTPTLADIPA